MLQATELGLGTVWVCFFKPDVIKKEFQLPDNLEPIKYFWLSVMEKVLQKIQNVIQKHVFLWKN